MNKLTFIILLFFSSTSIVEACTCNFVGTVKEEIERVDLVFIGKVISKTWIELEEDSYFQIEIELLEKFKGNLKAKVILVRTGPSLPSCGFYFRIGKKYAIYAFLNDSTISTSQCTRTTHNWKREKKSITEFI